MDKRFIDVCANKTQLVNTLKIIEGLSNWCSCGEIGLTKKQYIQHIKEIQRRSLSCKKHNQLAAMSGLDFFFSDEAETYYSGIDTTIK